MGEKNGANAGGDQELEGWTAQAVAEVESSWGKPVARALGVRPSGEDIWRIAQRAEQYVLLRREGPIRRDWQKACKRVDETADAFRRAITDSARYYQNLAIAWKQEYRADKALDRMQQLAREHAQKRGKRSKRNEPLRSLTDAVIHAYHNAGKTGLGISTAPDTGKLYGPVLNAVKESLQLAGIPEQEIPSDSTIRNAAREINKDK